jgi:hypothetical protein
MRICDTSISLSWRMCSACVTEQLGGESCWRRDGGELQPNSRPGLNFRLCCDERDRHFEWGTETARSEIFPVVNWLQFPVLDRNVVEGGSNWSFRVSFGWFFPVSLLVTSWACAWTHHSIFFVFRFFAAEQRCSWLVIVMTSHDYD